MKTVKVKVYEYKELNEEAKGKAREWFLDDPDLYQWEMDTLVEGAKTVGLVIVEMYPDGQRRNEGRFMVSAEDTAKRIVKEHGKKCETYKTAKQYLEETKGEPEDLDSKGHDVWADKCQQAEEDFLSSILEDYRIMARHGMEYVESEAYISEGMEANGYTFTKDGKRFG